MDIDNELSKLADKDLDVVIGRMLSEGVIDKNQYQQLMDKDDRNVKEVVAYLGYLHAKRASRKEDDLMSSLSPVAKKVVASVKKDLKRIKSNPHAVKHIPKVATQHGFLDRMRSLVKQNEDQNQKELNEALDD